MSYDNFDDTGLFRQPYQPSDSGSDSLDYIINNMPYTRETDNFYLKKDAWSTGRSIWRFGMVFAVIAIIIFIFFYLYLIFNSKSPKGFFTSYRFFLLILVIFFVLILIYAFYTLRTV